MVHRRHHVHVMKLPALPSDWDSCAAFTVFH